MALSLATRLNIIKAYLQEQGIESSIEDGFLSVDLDDATLYICCASLEDDEFEDEDDEEEETDEEETDEEEQDSVDASANEGDVADDSDASEDAEEEDAEEDEDDDDVVDDLDYVQETYTVFDIFECDTEDLLNKILAANKVNRTSGVAKVSFNPEDETITIKSISSVPLNVFLDNLMTTLYYVYDAREKYLDALEYLEEIDEEEDEEGETVEESDAT